MASNNIKPKSPPASPLTSPKGKSSANTKKENELKLKYFNPPPKEAPLIAFVLRFVIIILGLNNSSK
jgi:hypothetical protein